MYIYPWRIAAYILSKHQLFKFLLNELEKQWPTIILHELIVPIVGIEPPNLRLVLPAGSRPISKSIFSSKKTISKRQNQKHILRKKPKKYIHLLLLSIVDWGFQRPERRHRLSFSASNETLVFKIHEVIKLLSFFIYNPLHGIIHIYTPQRFI